jgi:hypothetical protein
LDEILQKAVVNWQKGLFFEDEARETAGNRSTIKWGKAVRCFTRSQAFARQVYQSLIPPPKRPEDLGLKPWLGSWGDWATRGEN